MKFVTVLRVVRGQLCFSCLSSKLAFSPRAEKIILKLAPVARGLAVLIFFRESDFSDFRFKCQKKSRFAR
jgi:hypothetical protein